MNIAELLDRPIAFQRSFVTLTGSVTAALMLSQAIYWQNRTAAPDGWWWKTQEDWEEETGLTRREQETARTALRNLQHNGDPLWREERRGLPAKLYFCVNIDVLDALIGILVWRKTPISSGGKRQSLVAENANHSITETTTETTAETTTDGSLSASSVPAAPAPVSPPTPKTPKPKPTKPAEPEIDIYADTPYRNLADRLTNEGFGLMTQILADQVKAAMEKYPATWLDLAIQRAVAANARRWAYVVGILTNWEREGFDTQRRSASNGKSKVDLSLDAVDRVFANMERNANQ